MKITDKDLDYVARLARIHIDDEKKERLTHDMEAVIKFADKLAELDTENVEPVAHALPVNNVFRKDEIVPSYDREKLLKNAPEKDAGCYSVPKIVE